ncbi:hypothetical protein F2Q69_00051196 [Brassica cretica]|uniref:Uncharacterized protein n=1 Tax=Brassica cretica TaxID=69181 RepID=A0A8S9Q6I2_BRACR|nr:hypothetical protein F2Q69_00051196 [Brassica cretica]
MDDMNTVLQEEAEIFEAQAKGSPFTWWNNQEDNPISKKIDHSLINQAWANSFPDSFAEYLEPDQSDPAPCLFRTPSVRSRIRKPFKFYHHIIDNPEFLVTVGNAWHPESIVGIAQFKLMRSMKCLKKDLRGLNKRHYSGISERVKQQGAKVEVLQRALLTSPDRATDVEEHRERDTLNKLFTAEQKFYRQRSRVRWADVGDRNTTFYHKTVNQRVTQNHIHYLRDEDNNFFGTTSAIKEHSAAYFQ